jgi:hypothetical protein
MSNVNDITGDKLRSKFNTKQYRDNWDAIFRKKEDVVPVESVEQDTIIKSTTTEIK